MYTNVYIYMYTHIDNLLPHFQSPPSPPGVDRPISVFACYSWARTHFVCALALSLVHSLTCLPLFPPAFSCALHFSLPPQFSPSLSPPLFTCVFSRPPSPIPLYDAHALFSVLSLSLSPSHSCTSTFTLIHVLPLTLHTSDTSASQAQQARASEYS